MGAYLLAGLGALVVLLTLIDIVATVIGVSRGHGVTSRVVSRTMWAAGLAVHRRRPAHWLLSALGPAIFIAITLAWAVLLIGGWVLVFLPEAALSPTNQITLSWWDRIDHACALVFGGSAPFAQAGGQPWSFIARLARFSGLGLASFGLAYALPVVGSVVRYRAAARLTASIHPNQHIIETAHADGSDSVTHLHLINLTTSLNQLAQEINAYPIVPYFHSTDESAVVPIQLRIVDEYLDRRDPDDTSVPDSVVIPLTSSIDAILDQVAQHFLPLDIDTPDDRAERRRTLLDAWLVRDGWSVDRSEQLTEHVGSRNANVPAG